MLLIGINELKRNIIRKYGFGYIFEPNQNLTSEVLWMSFIQVYPIIPLHKMGFSAIFIYALYERGI